MSPSSGDEDCKQAHQNQLAIRRKGCRRDRHTFQKRDSSSSVVVQGTQSILYGFTFSKMIPAINLDCWLRTAAAPGGIMT
eukprot:2934294-Pyramimonas_sp.AAC.2